MDIQDFLSINYLDLFENTESNFMLQDDLQNDWLENIFSSSSSSSSPSSSDSASLTTVSDCLLPDSISPDSGLPGEHSYSIGQSSPSTNSWSSAPDSGDSIDFLSDFRASDIALTSDLVKESESLETKPLFFTADDGEADSDLDRWLESSIPSPSSSSPPLPELCGGEPTDVPRQHPRRNVVLFTSIDGQVMKFTSEETEASDELVLVDCDYDDESAKDPIDLSVCRSNVMSSSSFEDQANGSVTRQISTQRVALNGFSGGHLINGNDTATCKSYTLTEALFSSPVPTEGLLLLTDEEKNTLITDGYPVPTKLPLGKAEEKYLKKIRRKIKNKLSAQESRRKKREYVDHLETKMHKYCEENTALLKKVHQLESNNRLLLVQLQKMMKYSGSMPSSGGTRLMVLVLFFAVFVGTWSPISWRVGFGRVSEIKDRGGEAGVESAVWTLHPLRCVTPVGPDLQLPTIDTYSSVSARSRLLMSTKDEENAYDGCLNASPFGPSVPASYMTTIAFWFANYGLPGGYPELNARSTAPVNETADDDGPGDASSAERGFSVQQILPLTKFLVFRDAGDNIGSSNVTFVGFSSPTQPMLPVTLQVQPGVRQMTLRTS